MPSRFLMLLLLLGCLRLPAQPLFESGELFIRFEEGKGESYGFEAPGQAPGILRSLVTDAGAFSLTAPFFLDHPDLRNTWLLRTGRDLSEAELKLLAAHPDVRYVERVPHYETFLTPNDPLLSVQWALSTVDATAAWDINTGNPATTIAIVDDAVYTAHPDLAGKIWTNPGEVPGNGIDDDLNGYVDDVNGWDAAENDNDANPPVLNQSYFTHGTHVAGIAAAATDNATGIAGMGFNCSIIPVKTKSDASTGGSLQAPYLGVQYAIAIGPHVMNNSWGGTIYSATYQALFDQAYLDGIVVVAAAGNSNTTNPMYPASYNHVISVGATAPGDAKASFSNYGPTIDVMAPGQAIHSTMASTTNPYADLSGTSMAAPLVAGLAGLMRSFDPALSVDDLETCLESTCDNIDAQNPNLVGLIGAGRINAEAALLCLDPVVPGFTSNFSTVCPGGQVQFTDLTNNGPTAWNWTFQGGVPATSNLQNPVVSYPNPGVYDVRLIVTNPFGTDTLTQSAYVTAAFPTAILSGGSTILAGYSSTLQVNFTGNPPWDFSYTDGNSTFNVTGVGQSPYYLVVSPAVTTTYSLASVSDALCAGNASGNGIVTVIANNGCSASSSFIKTFGGPAVEITRSMSLTSDGGCILAGATSSFGAGQNDAYVIKLDGCGLLEWSKTYGSADDEYGTTISQTFDGGYILGSFSTYGPNGTISHWIQKLDALGNVTWSRSYGGAPFHYVREVLQTPDGGYVFCGVSGTGAGANDIAVVKLDAAGNVQWQRAYGGNSNDFGHNIALVPTGGFIAYGYKRNYNPDYSLYAIRLDANGNPVWAREFNMPGSNENAATVTVLDNDQGFLFAGSYTTGGTATNGIVIKTDTSGNLLWAKGYGGTGDEVMRQVLERPNGQLVGMASSSSAGAGGLDICLMEMDAQGNVLSSVLVGGNQDENFNVASRACALSPTGNITFLARTASFGAGADDFLVCRTDVNGLPACDTSAYLMPFSTINPVVINNPPSVNNTNFTVSSPVPTIANPPTLEGVNCNSIAPVPFCLNIQSVQKISATQGNFTATLDNGDQFGSSVVAIGDINGDGVQDLAVGANLDDDGGTDYGAFYILLMNTDGTLQSQQKIASNVGGFTGLLYPLGAMGRAIEPVGDMNNDGVPDLAVGVGRDNDGGMMRGAIFILFMNANGTVGSQQKISDTQGNFLGVLDDQDRFGSDITNLGDLDGNGTVDLGVAVPFDDDGGLDRGAFYILYMNPNGTVLGFAKVSDTQGGFTAPLDNEDNFGVSLDNMGDVDGNGVVDIVVGARLDDDGGPDRGAAYILLMNANGTASGYYKISATQGNFSGSLDDGDRFGISVRNAGDMNGDNVNDLLVGAYLDDDGGTDKGAAYLLYLNANGSVQGSYKISESQPIFSGLMGVQDNFGWAVAPIGDLDNNGMDDFAFGAVQSDDGGPNRGAVWIVFMEDSCQCQSGNMLTFQRRYGGINLDEGHGITTTLDGNIILTGVTESLGAGGQDFFVMKADLSGNPIWMKTYGSLAVEDGNSVNIERTANGGYVLIGNSTVGGAQDPVVLRLDPNGQLLWQTRITGNGADFGRCIVETSDGGFACGGSTISYSAGSNDEYIFKLDANGNLLWTRTLGLAGPDHVTGIVELANGNLVGACHPRSYGVGFRTAEFVCLGPGGNVLWTRMYDGNQEDAFLSMDLCADGSFVGVGYSTSFGAGNRDVYVVKTDSAGNLQWARSLGGAAEDMGVGIQQSSDGGFVIGGYTASYGNGGTDMLGIKLDAQGNLDWARTYGGPGNDQSDVWGDCVAQGPDGGFYFLGFTDGFGASSTDIYLVKTDVCGNSWCNETDITAQINVTTPAVAVGNTSGTIGTGGVQAPLSLVEALNFFGDSIICISNPQPPIICNVVSEFLADTVCFGDSTHFTDLSQDTAAINFWLWDFGDGSGTAGQPNPAHLYTAPGIYTVTLISGNVCTDTFSLDVLVETGFNVSLVDDTICLFDSLPLAQLVAGCGLPPYSFAWSPAAGLSSTTDSVPLAAPASTTTYTVVVTDQNGNQETEQVTVTVDVNCCVLHIGLLGDSTVCAGDSVQFSYTSNDPGVPALTWLFGPGAVPQSFNGPNPPPVQFNGPGYQQVMLAAAGACGPDTAYFNVYVNPLPAPFAGNDTSVCTPDTLQLGDAPIAYMTYAWSPAAGLSDPSIANPMALVTGSVTYVLTMTDDVTGCAGMDTVTITADAAPVIDLPGDTSICPGSVWTIVPSIPSGNLLQWQDGSSGPTFPASAAGWYWAVSANSCGSDTDSVFVDLRPVAAFDLGPDVSGCEGTAVTLTPVVQSGSIEQWSDGSSGPSLLVQGPGIYWLEMQGDPACPALRDSVLVDFTPLPAVLLPQDTALCPNETFVLVPSLNTPSALLWSDGSAGPSLNVVGAGAYAVTASNACGSDSDDILVGVSPPLDIDLGPDTTICDDEPLTLSPGAGFAAYLWQDGSTESAYLAVSPGFYTVEVVDGFGCLGRAQVQIWTENCFWGLYVPNAFTPNNSPPNDLFEIVENGVTLTQLQIFNRWGALIYEAYSVDDPWDGTFNGQEVQEGAYVYLIRYRDRQGESGTLKGTVTVIR